MRFKATVTFVLLSLALAGGGAYLYLARKAGPPPQFPKANLVLISIDTLRADVLGFMGNRKVSTPRLDAFAGEGIVFEHTFAAANDTGPAHASMLTGYSVPVHGVLNINKTAPRKIPNSTRTLAERLKDKGYKTAAWADGGYVTRLLGFDRGFDHFESDITGSAAKTPSAMKWMEGLGDAPGFLFFHTYEVHAPYRIAPAQAERVSKEFSGSVIPNRMRSIQRSGNRDLGDECAALFASPDQFTDLDRECLFAFYKSAVEKMDRNIGNFLDLLKAGGFYDNTIIVITSDHGEEFGEHGKYQHASLYDEVMHVPLVVRLPGGLHAGSRVKYPVSSLDIVPSLMDLLKLEVPRDIEGESRIHTIVNDEGATAPRVLFATLDSTELIAGFAARTMREKLLFWTGRDREVRRAYDLVADPAEREVVPGDSKRFQTLDESLHEARRLWKSLGEVHLGTAGTSVMDENTLRDLRALGYTGK